MRGENGYKYTKVIIGLTLSPALAGLVLGIYVVCYGYWNSPPKNIATAFIALIIGPLVTAIGGEFFFFPPALLLGTISAVIQLRRTTLACLFVFLIGGASAYSWSLLLSSWKEPQSGGFEDKKELSLFPEQLDMKSFAPALLGAISSLIVALVVLPKPKN